MERKTILLVLAGFVTAFTADLLSKGWVERALALGQPVSIIGDVFRITLGYNTGVAFGMFANIGILTTILTGIVIIGLSVWMFRALRSYEVPQVSALALGFILGGALGNFVDRFVDGRVTDFLDVGIGALRWPTFNLADSFVVIGIAMLLLLNLPEKRDANANLEKA